ncbi:hypothetical protein [Candidatus Synechococcus spongiarum]|uniref:hypothetical protein n=1 Tax=Candidatus Synechococcus spongiarum TaxID=431041 RepID=UPI0015D67184|nr:hypothetical protein [Candidatus Synechococcus spongiarum]
MPDVSMSSLVITETGCHNSELRVASFVSAPGWATTGPAAAAKARIVVRQSLQDS